MNRLIHYIFLTIVLANQATAQSEDCVQIGTQCQKRSDQSLIIRDADDLADLGAAADAPWIRFLFISGSEDFVGEIDLSVVSSLTQLDRLSLENLEAFDASEIQSSSLASLLIKDSRPLDYGFTASLESLEALQLINALDTISDLPLEDLGQLRHLAIVNSEMTSIAGVETLQNLEGIALTNTSVNDLGPLAALNLRGVTIVSDQITDLSPLGSSSDITHLHIGGSSITSLDGLSLGQSLEHFRGSNSNLSDISALDAATNVKRVLLEQANITDISALSGKSQLEHLDLRKNPLSDLTPLVDLPSLTRLDLSDTMIFDLAPLEKLTSVEHISLSRIPAEDISPLSGMTSVEALWLNDTLADDLSPILAMPSLDSFIVDDQQFVTKDNLPAYMETRSNPSGP